MLRQPRAHPHCAVRARQVLSVRCWGSRRGRLVRAQRHSKCASSATRCGREGRRSCLTNLTVSGLIDHRTIRPRRWHCRRTGLSRLLAALRRWLIRLLHGFAFALCVRGAPDGFWLRMQLAGVFRALAHAAHQAHIGPSLNGYALAPAYLPACIHTFITHTHTHVHTQIHYVT